MKQTHWNADGGSPEADPTQATGARDDVSRISQDADGRRVAGANNGPPTTPGGPATSELGIDRTRYSAGGDLSEADAKRLAGEAMVELSRALMALRLEVAPLIADDLTKKVNAALDAATAKIAALTAERDALRGELGNRNRENLLLTTERDVLRHDNDRLVAMSHKALDERDAHQKEAQRLTGVLGHVVEHITRDEDFDADELRHDIESSMNLDEFNRFRIRAENAEAERDAARAEVLRLRDWGVRDDL